MKNKGMIITSLLYAILTLFILILFSIIFTIGIRKNLVDVLSENIKEEAELLALYKGPIITGDYLLTAFTNQTIGASNLRAGLTAIDPVDGDISNNITCSNVVGTYPNVTATCSVTNSRGMTSAPFNRRTRGYLMLVYRVNYSYYTFVAPANGTYRIELWGAQGGNYANGAHSSGSPIYAAVGGLGTYVAGNVSLEMGQKLYIYVGSSPSDHNAGYNGGGSSTEPALPHVGMGGGGATDVRLISGDWNNQESLRSRIIVAGGGGGGYRYETTTNIRNGGPAGTLTGGNGGSIGPTIAVGATQILGGYVTGMPLSKEQGYFGIGGSVPGPPDSTFPSGGGGGGYYGGAAGHTGSGSGGSSFISGATSYNAIDIDGNHTGQPNHYSGFVFTNIAQFTDIQHHSGVAKITFVP